MLKIVPEVENRLGSIRTPLKVALMGCMVNGPERPGSGHRDRLRPGSGSPVQKGRPVRRIEEARIISEFIRK